MGENWGQNWEIGVRFQLFAVRQSAANNWNLIPPEVLCRQMRIVVIYKCPDVLDVAQLSVRYPGLQRPAVDTTLGLNAGDIGVLIGPSGCGKTTLLRAVAGLETISQGQIHLGGQRISSAAPTHEHLAPELRHIGMVFQDYALFPHLRCSAEHGFLVCTGKHASSSARRVAQVLALVELTGTEQRMPHELSGGQQQRVALARALAPAPVCCYWMSRFLIWTWICANALAHEVRGIIKSCGATAPFVTTINWKHLRLVIASALCTGSTASVGRCLQPVPVPASHALCS